MISQEHTIGRLLMELVLPAIGFALSVGFATQDYPASLVTGFAISGTIYILYQLDRAFLHPQLEAVPRDWLKVGLEMSFLLVEHVLGALLVLLVCSRLFRFQVVPSVAGLGLLGIVIAFPIVHGTETALRYYRQLQDKERQEERLRALAEPPLVIFVTAYDEYAIRAFEVNAVDYLLKPFSQERLTSAVRRAQQELIKDRNFNERLTSLLENLADQGQYAARLAVHDYRSGRDSIRVLDTEHVDWIGIERDEVMVHVGQEAYAVRRTLSELEARLAPACFFRAHRSAIVNLDRVQEIIPWFKGSHRLRLTTGAELDLGRRRAQALREILRW